MTGASGSHWDGVYRGRSHDRLSWFQSTPSVSLRLVGDVTPPGGAVVDVGAGASVLVDDLLDAGFEVTVVDVAAEALAAVTARLGDRGSRATCVVADVLAWRSPVLFDTWHDRAVFHFLVDPADRERYVEAAAGALRPDGHVVLGTFASDGPRSCSGLPTAGYDAADLAAVFGRGFTLVASEREEHRTPDGVVQPFTWVVLRRDRAAAGGPGGR